VSGPVQPAVAHANAASALLGFDPNPRVRPGAKADEVRVAPDGHPARVVKAHNVHKAGLITEYSHTGRDGDQEPLAGARIHRLLRRPRHLLGAGHGRVRAGLAVAGRV